MPHARQVHIEMRVKWSDLGENVRTSHASPDVQNAESCQRDVVWVDELSNHP